jgi:hypothetical protein
MPSMLQQSAIVCISPACCESNPTAFML